MSHLFYSSLFIALLIGCKPTSDDNQRTSPSYNYSTDNTTPAASEKSFDEWSGRSDLKLGWTFETIP